MDVCLSWLLDLDNESVARGWLAGVDRSATESGDDRLAGWLALVQGYFADDPARHDELLARALDCGRAQGDTDLELVALADLGFGLVERGDVRRGMALLDEALAGTLATDVARLETVVWNCCSMLAACRIVGDLARAAQWCGAADSFAARYGCPFLQARCRAHYGRVLVATGRWEQAEVELSAAITLAAHTGRGPRLEAVTALAELRVRQGEFDEAAALLAQVPLGLDTASASAQVQLALGHADRAVALLETELDGVDPVAPVVPSLLVGLVEAHLASGDIAQAGVAAARLEALLAVHEHPQAPALADRAQGLVAAAQGSLTDAVNALRRAVAGFDELGLDFEAATTRLALAEAVTSDQPALAVVLASHASTRLEELGAHRAADRATRLLRSLGVTGRPGPRSSELLTHREREVLALVEQGLTNPQIGERLYISPRTVAHHVSSILAKLRLSTRSEAAAYAARAGAAQLR